MEEKLQESIKAAWILVDSSGIILNMVSWDHHFYVALLIASILK